MNLASRFLTSLMVLSVLGGGMCLAAEEKVAGKAGETIEFVYSKTDAKALTVLVTFPTDWKPSDKRPGMVFFFGGGWTKGTPKQFEPQAAYFASRGLVTLRADYRLGMGAPVCVEDARSAVCWMRAHAAELGIDADKVISSGGSAGGHLAACVGVRDEPKKGSEAKPLSSQSNAMVLFNPVLDMEKLGRDEKLTGDEKQRKAISPILHLQKTSPPAIIFFGTSDRLASHGDEFLEKGAKLGARVELYTAPEQPHGFFNRSPWQEATMYQADLFLTKLGYLKGEPTIKVPANAKLSAVEVKK